MAAWEAVLFQQGDMLILVKRGCGVAPKVAAWKLEVRFKDWHWSDTICRSGVVSFARSLLKLTGSQ